MARSASNGSATLSLAARVAELNRHGPGVAGSAGQFFPSIEADSRITLRHKGKRVLVDVGKGLCQEILPGRYGTCEEYIRGGYTRSSGARISASTWSSAKSLLVTPGRPRRSRARRSPRDARLAWNRLRPATPPGKVASATFAETATYARFVRLLKVTADLLFGLPTEGGA